MTELSKVLATHDWAAQVRKLEAELKTASGKQRDLIENALRIARNQAKASRGRSADER